MGTLVPQPSLPPTIADRAAAARLASRTLGGLSTSRKNAVLVTLADLIDDPAHAAEILNANGADMRAAIAAELSAPKLTRLELTAGSLSQLSAGVRQVVLLADPIGVVMRETAPSATPSGLHVRKVRAPLGVVAMIYEARPGVTIDAFTLCFKAGNACILRGGKEAQHSNAALATLVHRALAAHGVSENALVNLSGTSREHLAELLTMDKHIDLVIPRGGRDLIEMVRRTSRIPTVQHDQGVCHIYVDESADVEMAVQICALAKTSAPATCNAVECVLVHRGIAERFVPRMLARYAADRVEVRASTMVMAFGNVGCGVADVGSGVAASGAARRSVSTVVPAQPDDFGREFLDLVVAMRTVDSIDEAIEHIALHGSNHTEAIITRDTGPGGAADRFVGAVRSSCVLVNASTRFNDGFQLGLGAEIGISTSRVHAYGPMGLEELTTQRWIAIGNGQAR